MRLGAACLILNWLGWTGMVVGAVIFALGAVQFVRPNVVFPGVLFYGGGTLASQLWTLVLGTVMWRRGAPPR